MSESDLEFIGYAVVVFDIEDGSDVIRAWPVKQLAEVNGKLADYKENSKISTMTIAGENVSATVDAVAHLSATWSPAGNYNRMTAPSVKKGETVQLWKKRSTQLYVWTNDQLEPTLRRREHVIHRYSAKDDDKDMNDTNSVKLEINTLPDAGYIEVSTPTSEGVALQLRINYRTGEVTLGGGDSHLGMDFGKSEFFARFNKSTFDGDVVVKRGLTANGRILAKAGCAGCR